MYTLLLFFRSVAAICVIFVFSRTRRDAKCDFNGMQAWAGDASVLHVVL